MDLHTLGIYFFVSFFYVISPGPAVFLAVYNGAMSGTKTVVASALGNITGLLFLSTLSISGLSAILLASSLLFTTVKLVGAAYLIYLGVKQLRSPGKKSPPAPETVSKTDRRLLSFYREGFLVAATNPKPILFFVALFPQFIDTQQPVTPQFLIMTLMFMLISFTSLSVYGFLASRAGGLLSHAQNLRWFNRISGGLFIGMGTTLLYVKRTG
ncbi:LysE family translocator [Vibrio quintilis]|uniref:Homoserine/homoserine lactone efflux protein n=1 Tax=Vibrio quintilis TaxID=1117707 RepID=A0A1M7YXZ0_9VIBR|nr:LysE family translocator [Vibrio quintilis]SHO57547.1 Homoserine/homoserine lactone efflux protein [Vibrio quintilis]